MRIELPRGNQYVVEGRYPSFLYSSVHFIEYSALAALKRSALEFKETRSRESFDRMMEHIPDDCKNLLEWAIWMEAKCPAEPDFGHRVLTENPWILFEKELPVISQHGGTFLDQLLHYIHVREREKYGALAKDQLLLLKDAARRSSHISFESLVPELHTAIAQKIYDASSGEREEGFGERRLNEDALSLFLPLNGTPLVDVLLEECEKIRNDHTYLLSERPLRVFEVASPLCTLQQRERMFDALPEGDKHSIGRRLDAPFWGIGIHSTLHHFYGAHSGEGKTVFRFYAPHAREVKIKIFWKFDPVEVRGMMNIGGGNFETTFFAEMETVPYEFELVMGDGSVLTKTDPFARGHCLRPDPRAVVRTPWFHWEDHEWMRDRTSGDTVPRTVYKVILGAWNGSKPYSEQADELAAYCKDMGFTHIELPLCEYQTDGSLGYQAFGFFAPTSRFGTLHDFQSFVNILHREGIGVIVDLPTHFVPEGWSLDGMGIFEGDDTRYGTKSFRWENPFVRNFFISAIRSFLEMHVDGVRLDFVEQMISKPYGHLALQEISTVIHGVFPTALLITENAVDARDTVAIEAGGLGYDRQIALGEMTLLTRQLEKPFSERNMEEVAHVLDMLRRERGVLAFSHDVYPMYYGDWWKRLAQMRLLFGVLGGSNADTLCFMGHELGFEHRPNPHEAMHWYAAHHGLRTLVKDINHLHLRTRALWQSGGIECIARDDTQKVIGFLRRASDGSKMVVITHFGETGYAHFFLRMARVADRLTEVLNTDAEWYGGTGEFMNREIGIGEGGIELKLPPLATLFFSL